MRAPWRFVFLLGLASPAVADPLGDAIALVEARRYPEARESLEKILGAEPANATAHHYLGRTLVARNDATALEEGLKHLQRSVELQPDNPRFLESFGTASLQLAGKTSSLSRATQGRDALEKSLTIEPTRATAREALVLFYQRAPWPLGSSSKGGTHLEALRRTDPDLAMVLSVTSQVTAKDFTGAFRQCDEVLQRQPDNYAALYHYGRTASICGQNLEPALAHLQRCLQLTPPTPASPTHSHVWHRIGVLQERLQQLEEARRAFEEAVKLDPSNRQAVDALNRLR